MSIQSHAFGHVTLTERDAEKFEQQVRYGRPKKEAVASLQRGTAMARAFAEGNGEVVVKVKRAR